MTKKRSKSLFVIFAIILVIGLLATFVNFTYPLTINGKYFSYSNFVSNLKLGEDIGQTYRIIYRAELLENEIDSNYDNLTNSAMQKILKIVENEGFKDATITRYGEDQVALQVAVDGEEDITNLTSLVGEPARISFSMEQDQTKAFIDASNIKDVSSQSYYNSETGKMLYYVRIDFNDDVKDEIATKTADGGKLYIYFGDELFTQMDLGGNAITDGMIVIQSDAFTSQTVANTYANKIRSGMLDVNLTKIDAGKMSATYGRGASVYVYVLIAVFAIAVLALLVVKYRDMGWLSAFAMLFFVVIGLFLLQSIPAVHLNFAGVIGLMLAYLLMADSLVSILENAKRHYQADTKLYIAFKLAFKESLVRIFVNNTLFALLGFACMFMPSLGIQSFGWVAFVLPFVSVFVSLALMRLFVAMYLAINNEDGKKCNFHKGGKNA